MIGHTFIVYVVFSNPIHITSGLFIYAFITLLLGWIGFLFGELDVHFLKYKKKVK